MFKTVYLIIILYIIGLISLILLEFFDIYFSKKILTLFKFFTSISFLLILSDIIKSRFFKKN